MREFIGSSLRMCLLFPDRYWEALLDQEGLEWEHAPSNIQSLDKYPLVLIPKVAPTDMIRVLKKYSSEGGCILTIKDNQKIITGEITKVMLPYSKYDYSKIWNEKIKSNYYIKNVSKRNQLFYFTDQIGKTIIMPFDICNILDNTDFKRKYFYTGDEPVGEYISCYSKGNLRIIFSNLIKLLYSKRQLPIIKKWYYPEQFNSVFSFRVDVDNYFKLHFEALRNASKNFKEFMTWFFCCSAFENHKGIITKMKKEGFDIQSHGYFHFTFKKYKFSKWNLEKSKIFLNDLIDENIKGYVSPGGFYYPSLRKALMDQEFLYSSEFSFDYDNFPLYQNDISNPNTRLIHIPVHPICYGSFHQNTDINENSEIIPNYFRNLISQKYYNFEPIILYGHPTDKLGANIGFYKKLMEMITPYKKVWKTNLSEFSNWWNYRHQVKFRTEYNSINKIVKIVVPNDVILFSQMKYSLLYSVEYGDLRKKISANTSLKKPNIKTGGYHYEELLASPQIGNTILLDKIKLINKKHFYRREYIYLIYFLMKKRNELFLQRKISKLLMKSDLPPAKS